MKYFVSMMAKVVGLLKQKPPPKRWSAARFICYGLDIGIAYRSPNGRKIYIQARTQPNDVPIFLKPPHKKLTHVSGALFKAYWHGEN